MDLHYEYVAHRFQPRSGSESIYPGNAREIRMLIEGAGLYAT